MLKQNLSSTPSALERADRETIVINSSSAPTSQIGRADRSDRFYKENCEEDQSGEIHEFRRVPVRANRVRIVLKSVDHSEYPQITWRHKKYNRWDWKS